MRPETGIVRPMCVQWFEGRWLVFLLTRLPSHPKCAWVASSLPIPKNFSPDKHIRSISNVNPIDEDFSDSVQPLTVELNLGRLELWGGELELACVGPVLLTHPPSVLVRNLQRKGRCEDTALHRSNKIFWYFLPHIYFLFLPKIIKTKLFKFKFTMFFRQLTCCGDNIPVLDIIKPVVQILVQNSRLRSNQLLKKLGSIFHLFEVRVDATRYRCRNRDIGTRGGNHPVCILVKVQNLPLLKHYI